MIRFRIRLAIAALALPLAGCNVVMSDHPWFTPGADDPHLAPGLWVAVKDASCTYNPSDPLQSWPECAKPFYVRGADLLTAPEAKEGEPPLDPAVFTDLAKWQSSTPTLVAGNPMVMEMRADVTQPGVEPGAAAPKMYLYLAVQPQSRTADGAVQSVRVWPVFCGPPPPPPKRAHQTIDQALTSGVSAKPFPGLRKAKAGCEATSADAIRKAAALSEAVAVPNEMPPFTAKWLRATLTP